MFSPEDVFSALYPMFYLTKIIGLVPFDLNKNCNHSISVFTLIWSSSIVFLQGYFCIFNLINFVSYRSIILTILEILELASSSLNMVYLIIVNYVYSKQILEVIFNISEFDKSIKLNFKNIDLKRYYRNKKINVLLSTIFMWCLILSIFLMNINCNYHKFTLVFLLSHVSDTLSFCIIFEEQQCYVFLVLVKERFVWLNNITKNLIKPNKIIVSSTLSFRAEVEVEDYIANLHRIGILHYNLCTISKNINKLYSGPIIMIVFKVFLFAVDIFFFNIKFKLISMWSISYCGAVSTVFNVILFSALIFFLVKICSSTSVEAKKLKVNITEIMDPIVVKRPDLIDLEILNILLQVNHQKVRLTAGGLFPIDETLITMMFGTIVYYCIVILQLDITISAKNVNKL